MCKTRLQSMCVQVLVSEHTAWADDCHGRVPINAIVIGQSCNGENLYMGRVMHDGTLTPGKVMSMSCSVTIN